jgi:hypothetical protein
MSAILHICPIEMERMATSHLSPNFHQLHRSFVKTQDVVSPICRFTAICLDFLILPNLSASSAIA